MDDIILYMGNPKNCTKTWEIINIRKLQSTKAVHKYMSCFYTLKWKIKTILLTTATTTKYSVKFNQGSKRPKYWKLEDFVERYWRRHREMERYAVLLTWRIHIIEIPILPKATYRLNAIHVKISTALFTRREQKILKCVWVYKGPWIAKAS